MTAGAVLAGGSSRRMGSDKAALVIDGQPMAVLVAGALAEGGCEPVIVVGGAPLPGLDTVPDLHPGDGPLGGVITALRHLGADTVVAACDLPDLDAASVASVAARERATRSVVRVARTEVLQPQLARWPIAVLPTLEELFAAGERSLRGALAALDVEQVTVGAAPLLDLDTPADVEARTRAEPGDQAPGR